MSDDRKLRELREQARANEPAPARIPVAKVLAIGVVIGVIIVVMATLQLLAKPVDYSAIQVMQIYIQAGFWLLVAIALLLAGLLVRS